MPKQELEGCGLCVKYLLFATNFIFFLLSCGLIATGIWLVVDRNFMSVVFGSVLFTAGAYLIIAGGIIAFFISFFGCCGAMRENRCMLLTYISTIALIILLTLTGGALVFVFRSEIKEEVKHQMTQALRKDYGVNQNNPWNYLITESWDQAQTRLRCCAVDDHGWAVYRESEWYKAEPGMRNANRKMVPLSCCKTELDGSRDPNLVEKCQIHRQGPPALQSGPVNEGLYYRGCYSAGKQFIWDHSAVIIGAGIGVALAMIFGIIFAVCLYRMI